MEEQIEAALYEPWPRPTTRGRMIEVSVETPTSLVDPRPLQDGGRIKELRRHSGVHQDNLQTSVWGPAFDAIAEAAF